MKQKSYSVLIILLMLFSGVYYETDSPRDFSTTESKQENQFLQDQEINHPTTPAVRQSVVLGESYHGESVLIQHDYRTTFIGLDDFLISDVDSTESFWENGDLVKTRADADVSFWFLSIEDTADDESCGFDIVIRMKAYGEGTAYTRFLFYFSSEASGSATSGSYSYNENYTFEDISEDGYIYYRIAITGTSTAVTSQVFKMKQDGSLEYFGTSGVITWNHGLGDPLFVALKFAYSAFEADTVEEHVRSTYSYSSSLMQKLHTVSFSTKPYVYANISHNANWEFSSVNPGLRTTLSDTRTDVYSNDYYSNVEVLFTSNCTNYLAVEDVSSTYLTDVGFEGGTWQNDWISWETNKFETLELSTSIVFDGYYSLKAVQSAGTYGFLYTLLENGYYYVDVWVYVTEFTGAGKKLFFAWYDGSWNFEYIDTTITNIWQHLQFYAHIIGNVDGRNLELGTDATTATVYFDYSELLFQTSTTIQTTQSSEYEIESTLRSWDGYKNPVMPNEDVELELWDRTEQTLEESYSTTTDEYGVATWILEKGLELKEYEIRAYTTDSFFMNNEFESYDIFEQLTLSEILYSEWDTVTTTEIVDGMYHFTGYDDDSGNYFRFYGISGASFDITFFDYIYLELYSNVSNTNYYPKYYIQEDWTNYISYEVENKYSTGWNSFIGTIDEFTEYGTFDETNADWSRFDTKVNFGWVEFYFDNLHFIHASKLYFTPSYPTETDFAETVLGDAWDFSEGDKDDFSEPVYAKSIAVANGETVVTKDSGATNYYYGVYADYTSSPLDLNNYRYCKIRIKVSDLHANAGIFIYIASDSADFWSTDTSKNSGYVITTEGEYYIFMFDFSIVNSETDITNIERIRIQLNHEGGVYFVEDDTFSVDYIQFIHIDSWLEETNDYATDELLDAWDFEEYDSGVVLDGWQESVGGQTIEIEDGCFKVAITATDAYTRIKSLMGLSISASTYTQIVITIKTNEDNLRIMFAESNNNGITAVTQVGVANVFHTIVFDIDSAYWTGTETTLYLWLYDSSGNFEGDEIFWIEEIRLLHLEEMPYTTIQNYAGLESEAMDLSYNVWVDGYYFGVYQDPSLVPLIISTVGTHYIQVQPFKIDDCYITQNIYTWTYRVSLVDNYYTFLSYDYDLEGSINLVIKTFWANQTIDVWHNSTQLLDDEAEGDITTFYAVSQAYHEITVKVYNGADLWDEFVFGFKIMLPETIENYYLVHAPPSIDATAGLVYLTYLTYWGNCTYRLKDNSTWLASAVNEGSSVWQFTLNYGFHNFSVYIYQGEDIWDIIVFSLTIPEPSLTYHLVHFDVITVTGVGLPFSTVKTTVNDSRTYYPEQYYLENSYLIIKVYDFYGHVLFSTTATITEDKDIVLMVNFHEQMLVNNYPVPVEITISAINEDPNLNLTYVIGREGSITIYMLAESYNVYVEPLVAFATNETHITYYYPEETKYEELGIVTAKSYSVKLKEIPQLLDPTENDLEKELFVYKYAFWIALFLDALMLAFATAILKWGLLKVINSILMPFMYGFSWFGFKPKMLIRDEGGLRFIDLEQYQKLSKKEEKGVI